MAKSLVIVESPAKAKTINKFLGRDFQVRASMGHVRDLPKKNIGVDEDTFEATYEILPAKKKTVAELKKLAKTAGDIYLAADPDREGEAICWHLLEELKLSSKARFHRVLFNEITKRAVQEAFEHPIEIDAHKVDAQQARRILDRLVGYKISPLLWEKVRRGLSAGRVQSVAVRILCDREMQIRAFERQEYWSLTATMEAGTPPPFETKLHRIGEDRLTRNPERALIESALGELGWSIAKEIPVEDGAEGAITVELEATTDSPVPFVVTDVQAKEKKKNPNPPFITSKLQQDAARQLGFSVRKTMVLAQRLYEGREIGDAGTVGLITYMRTDSTRVSDEALGAARDFIRTSYGDRALPEKPREYRVAKQAQEAHEAIRPTSMEFPPDIAKPYLEKDELRLYTLIWNRFVASQMSAAIFDTMRADISAGKLTFRATGSVLKYEGWLSVYKEGRDEDSKAEEESGRLPSLTVGDSLQLNTLNPKQHFTQPPPRYTEATLVKELEENGIGRPSTYASIIATITTRDYAEKEGRRLTPTELGMLVNELMVASFGDLVDVSYTARLEQDLDRIEQGDLNWIEALQTFRTKFEKDLEKAKLEMRNVKLEAIPTDEVCDKCGQTMVIKWGRFGQFLACSGYPECKNTCEIASNEDLTDEERAKNPGAVKSAPRSQVELDADPCEKCGSAMSLRRGRFGPFLACSGYPECKTTRKVMKGKDGKVESKADVLLEENCPKCESKLVLKQGRFGEFTACSNYPECRYIKMKETGVQCPDCDLGKVVERRSKRGKVFYGCDRYPDCEFVLWKKPVPKPCPDCNRPYLIEKVTKRAGHQLICDSESCDYIADADSGTDESSKAS
jgi:DNA topoisomerase-1